MHWCFHWPMQLLGDSWVYTKRVAMKLRHLLLYLQIGQMNSSSSTLLAHHGRNWSCHISFHGSHHALANQVTGVCQSNHIPTIYGRQDFSNVSFCFIAFVLIHQITDLFYDDIIHIACAQVICEYILQPFFLTPHLISKGASGPIFFSPGSRPLGGFTETFQSCAGG